jgi:membrane protein
MPGPRDSARLVRAGAVSLVRALCGEQLRLRAMALAFLSLFAVVPALVVAFSVVQAFSGMETLWRRVHDYLLENLAVGAQASIVPYLDRFVSNAHATSAGLVGGALLVLSAVSLFGYVERAVNDTWKVRRTRPLAQRALVYWAGLTLGPFLLAGSLALGHSVGAFLGTSPYGPLATRLAAGLLTCTLFTALYYIVPATRVRLGAAVAGGLLAGVAWELAKALYAFAVSRFFHYHAVYGSVAAVPIFLVWLHVSWTLVLFGARVSFVVQHARALIRGHEPETTPLGRELLAARTMLEVALAYDRAEAPPDPAEVAFRLESFAEPVRDIVGALRQAGLLLDVVGGGYVPARPLSRITLADVREAIAGVPPSGVAGSSEALTAGLLGAAEGAARASLAATSYEDLCARIAEAPGAPARVGGVGEVAPCL